jgi:diaminopimelate epimerase
VRKLHFTKMHGCGNDFVVFDDREGLYSWDDLARLAPRLCDRRFGIGADGLIAVGLCDEADFEMRYVNADGSRAEMCGNGIRCLGKFIAEKLHFASDIAEVLTGAGILTIELAREGQRVTSVTVSMGLPRLRAADVPTTLPELDGVVRQAHLHLGGEELKVTAVSMGNPHCVTFVDEITDLHVHGIGPQVERHEAFPRKVNAEFAQLISPSEIRLRVWERGCGETWACGTGACATVVAAVLNGKARHGDDVTVHLNGGDLVINWPARDQAVVMSGPAESVYEGEILLR